MSDAMDSLLKRIGERVNELEKAQVDLAHREARFKHWEAERKVTLIKEGTSISASETEVKADAMWASYYREVGEAGALVDKLKQQIKVGHAAFEAERSRFSANRKAG